MKIPSLDEIYAARNMLRETLNTPTLREWLKEDFWIRTTIAIQAIPSVFVHAWTVEPTYTVEVKDAMGTTQLNLTEREIRDMYGDAVFEEASRQMVENPGEDVYVRDSDIPNSWEEILGDAFGDQQWGTWGFLDPEDEDGVN